MRVVVQRVSKAKCLVENEITGQIDKGFLLLVGFTHTDTAHEIELLAKKVAGMRIFEDEAGKINKSLLDVGGSILAISQFTLYADCKKGNRPSFTEAMHYETAERMYRCFCEALKKYRLEVQMGVFGADMKLDFINDGPVTILLDSKEL